MAAIPIELPVVPDLPEEERERLGQVVRRVWIMWAQEQPNPKPSWLLPWEELREEDREVDRRIGATLYMMGMLGLS